MICMVALAAFVAATPVERSASLSYFNRPVFTARAPLMGVAPEERVRAALLRLDAITADTKGTEVTVVPVELGRAVHLNGRLVFFVQPGDLDPEAGVSLDDAAAQAAAALKDALVQSQALRDRAELVPALLKLALATALFLAAVVLVLQGRKRLLRVFERFAAGRKQPLSIGAIHLVQWSVLMKGSAWLTRVVALALTIVALTQWLAFSLSLFPYSRPWGDQLQAYLWSVAVELMLAIVHALPDVVVVVAIGWLTWVGTRVTGLIFNQIEEGRWLAEWFTPHTAVVTRKLVTLALVLFALVMAYPYLPGSQTEAFKGISVLVGLMVSLGGSSTVGQGAAGLILIYTRAFNVGDQVQVGEARGRVSAVGVFTTRLVTSQGEELVLPNATILASTTRNFTRSERVRVELKISIGYDVSWRQVEQLLLEGARRTTSLAKDAAPAVRIVSLEDFYVAYDLMATAAPEATREAVMTELNRHVLDAFNEAKVQIMSPHYMADPADPKLAEGRPA